jgi:flagellar M-ring protein FliF
MVFFGAIKPALKTMGTTAVAVPGEAAGGAGQLDAFESETLERPQLALTSPQEQAQISATEQRLEDARKLTRDNPAAVANIVKAWMNGESPAV